MNLFGIRVVWGNVTVSLADDGWVLAPSNCVHEPMCVVIVHNVHKTPPYSACNTTTLLYIYIYVCVCVCVRIIRVKHACMHAWMDE